MDTLSIDKLTTGFYYTISFDHPSEFNLASLKAFFFGDGILINNSFKKPVALTVDAYVNALTAQVADNALKHYIQREIFSKTEVFGKIAQRVSGYEYTFADRGASNMPRGVSYFQYIKVDGKWKITSMVWCDENEDHQITEELLRAR
jgi:hypothetical protein